LTAASFSLPEIAMATCLALAAQTGSLLLLRTGGGSALRADISDENRLPMAVAITPIADDLPLLKLGSKRQPGKLPDRWLAPKPVQRSQAASFPSPRAEAKPEAIPTAPVADAGQKPPPPDAELVKQSDLIAAVPDSGLTAVSNVLGSPDGVKEGTETDPLKAHAVSLYKAKLEAWFRAKFHIRGKIPFDKLKDLRATANVSISSDRTVGGYTIARPSGDPTFDSQLRAALDSAKGAEIPPPPPMYPDVLGETLHLSFDCKIRSQCE
jgi:TonB C terminal